MTDIKTGPDFAFPMEDAPKDGSILRLLVKFDRKSAAGAFEDTTEPSWTIGTNNKANTGEDQWDIVGWSWEQDVFCHAYGATAIGWLPFHTESNEPTALPPPSPAPAESGAVAFDIERFLQDDSKLPAAFPAPSASMGRVTDAMVQRAEIAVYGLHERGFIMRPLIDPIDMRAALEAALDCGVDGWQSIETAPKNRKMLVAYRNHLGNWRIVIACYHTRLPWSEDDGWNSESEFAPEAWYEESDSQDSILPTASAPTHWQPLPAPPALPTQASEDGR